MKKNRVKIAAFTQESRHKAIKKTEIWSVFGSCHFVGYIPVKQKL
jgi:hypothetical protein